MKMLQIISLPFSDDDLGGLTDFDTEKNRILCNSFFRLFDAISIVRGCSKIRAASLTT